jgi:hypothetical protein
LSWLGAQGKKLQTWNHDIGLLLEIKTFGPLSGGAAQ